MHRKLCILVLGVATFTIARAQTPTTPAEEFDFNKLAIEGKDLVAQAQAGNGAAGRTLAKYPGHYLSLNGRSKSGGAEFHRNWNDFLIVLDGEGTELTGGTIVDPSKENADGEIHGTRLEGATEHPLHKGDCIHIPAGTPHQQLVGPGQTLVILAIKVHAEPPTP